MERRIYTVDLRPGISAWLCGIALLCLSCGSVFVWSEPGQQKSDREPSAIGRAAEKANQNELATRLANAQAARSTGSPSAVAEANTSLIATASRELADLRAVEGAYPQAVELYKTSLALESRTATLLALATAEAKAGQYSEAAGVAKRVHALDPKNIQADRIESSSLIQSSEFIAALEPLQRVAASDHSVETQYALANCLLQTKRPADRTSAETIFKKIAQENGESGSLHVLIGRAYRDAGDLPAAIAQFQQALRIDANTPHAHYFLGLALLSQNEWRPTPEAEVNIRQEATLYPRDYLASYMSGFLLSGERRYDEAEPLLKTAASLNPSAPDPWLYLGLNAFAKDDMATAETDLRKAVELTGSDESRSNYQVRRAYVDLGRILSKSGHKEESETFLQKARDLQNKTLQDSQQTIANMAGAENGAAIGSITASEKIIPSAIDETAPVELALLKPNAEITPEQQAAFNTREAQLRDVLATAYNDLGTSEAVQGHFDAAASLYQKAESWDQNLPGLKKNLGLSEFRAGHFEATVSPLTQALLEQPASKSIRGMLGIAFFNLNRFNEAARTFEPLGRAGMQDGEVGYAWAASLARISDNARAAEVLNAFEAQQRSPEVQELVAQLWTVVGDYDRAIQTLQQALTINPNLPKAHFNEGMAYLHWQHWSEAAKEFQAELAVDPGSPDAEYHLGFVCMQQGNNAEALHLFEKVAAEHPEYANAQYQLGKIQLDNGDAPGAIDHLLAAERSSPRAAYIHYQLQAALRKAGHPDQADKELNIYKQLKADAREQAAEKISVH